MPARPDLTDPAVDPIDDLLACLGSAQGPPTPTPPPAPASDGGGTCAHVSQLPRGCLARDRHGDAVIVYPDGRYRRPGGTVIPPTIDSSTFEPFYVERAQLSDDECEALSRKLAAQGAA